MAPVKASSPTHKDLDPSVKTDISNMNKDQNTMSTQKLLEEDNNEVEAEAKKGEKVSRYVYLNPIPRGEGHICPPLPHFGNFLRKYLSEEAPTIL